MLHVVPVIGRLSEPEGEVTAGRRIARIVCGESHRSLCGSGHPEGAVRLLRRMEHIMGRHGKQMTTITSASVCPCRIVDNHVVGAVLSKRLRPSTTRTRKSRCR